MSFLSQLTVALFCVCVGGVLTHPAWSGSTASTEQPVCHGTQGFMRVSFGERLNSYSEKERADMATVIFYATLGEPDKVLEKGMTAVAWVICERVAHDRFPETLAEVLWQRTRGGNCQFAELCLAKQERRKRVKANPAHWQRSLRIAHEVLEGKRANPFPTAVFFDGLKFKRQCWARHENLLGTVGNQGFWSDLPEEKMQQHCGRKGKSRTQPPLPPVRKSPSKPSFGPGGIRV